MNKIKQQELVKQFDSKLKECISLIKDGKNKEAKDFFNIEIYDKYSKYILYSDSFMSGFTVPIIEMNEYFNNEFAKESNLPSTDKEYIIQINRDDDYLDTLNKFI